MPDYKPFYIGSCTWNYPSWVGLVYTQKQKYAADFLPEYAEKYNTVGIDSWFYRIPTHEEAVRYKKAVGKTFRFTCKVPQSITLTHQRKKKDDGSLVLNETFLSNDLFDQFIRNIEPVLDQTAAIMFEFEYLNIQKMPSLEQFLTYMEAFLTKAPKGLPYAIETRNPNYLTTTYFQFLNKHHIIPVLAEKLYMPHVYDLYETFRDVLQDTVVIRLLGGDRLAIEKKTKEQWNIIVEPKADDIEKIVAMIKDMLTRLTVVINVNNHYEGSAPRTIDMIKELLKKAGVPITPYGTGDGSLQLF